MEIAVKNTVTRLALAALLVMGGQAASAYTTYFGEDPNGTEGLPLDSTPLEFSRSLQIPHGNILQVRKDIFRISF